MPLDINPYMFFIRLWSDGFYHPIFLFKNLYLRYMANTYFQFKQFTIHQDKCAMKVCTDSCVFGAWIPIPKNTQHILDIGSGTGLLSLMMAQKTNAIIEGIEIENNAYLQSVENFNNSKWSDRLHMHHGNIKDFAFNKKFDFIICNPPFYENEKSSENTEENIAKHSMHLTLEELIFAIKNIVSEHGKFAILLPYFRKQELHSICHQNNFFLEDEIDMRQTPKHDFFRYAAVFTTQKNPKVSQEEITIKDAHNHYTADFVKLMQTFYLKL